jgi:pyrimidine operon attenuation protein/uracil phosphoribosyltransferase
MVPTDPKVIMDREDIERVVTRIAHEIVERNRDCEDLYLIGIRKRGVTLAQRISQKIKGIKGWEIPIGALDITLYRDDLSEIDAQPVIKKTEIPFSVKGRKIILVDDVLYTGRTVRAALDGIIDLGRPQFIQLAILLDRGHRELPIRADYIGKNIPTSRRELVEVKFLEDDGREEVVLIEEVTDGTKK